MKKIAVALVIGMVLTLIVGGVVLAAAQKLDLRANPPWCDVPVADEPVAGFVVLNNDNETDEVVVVVSLKEGASNQTYGIFLEEYKGQTGGRPNWLSWAYLGDLTTNRNGNGNFDTRISRSHGNYFLQIVVSYPWGHWGAESFGTDIAPITIK